ncbi:MAG: hypothetical protein WCO58_02525 [bacterium]
MENNLIPEATPKELPNKIVEIIGNQTELNEIIEDPEILEVDIINAKLFVEIKEASTTNFDVDVLGNKNDIKQKIHAGIIEALGKRFLPDFPHQITYLRADVAVLDCSNSTIKMEDREMKEYFDTIIIG